MIPFFFCDYSWSKLFFLFHSASPRGIDSTQDLVNIVCQDGEASTSHNQWIASG